MTAPSTEQTRVEAGREIAQEPLLLRWTDPESGEELAVEMYGSAEFALELAELGFEVREPPKEDETVSSLFVVIRRPAGSAGLRGFTS
jgi:hypothetical protein